MKCSKKPSLYLSLLLGILLFPELILAQQVKDVRLTYLWDVTLSMKGYNGSPDIYEKVVNAMAKDIESITNERTEIVVVPFQDSEKLDEWRQPATQEGKSALIKKIKEYKNDKVTNTNISAPILHSIDKIFSADRIDVMKLMTDGDDNVDKKKLERVLDSWCEMAKSKDVFGYYIMLTDAARKGEVLIREKEICRFETVQGIDIDAIVSLTPQKSVAHNLRDGFENDVVVKFAPNDGAGRVPEGFKVLVRSEDNPYVNVDAVAELGSDFTIRFKPEFKMTQDELKDSLPVDHNESVSLKFIPAVGMDKSPYSLIRILDVPVKMILVNKPEKTMRFYVR